MEEFLKKIDSMRGYVDLYTDESNLDGWFSATELRIIADAMDKLEQERIKQNNKCN